MANISGSPGNDIIDGQDGVTDGNDNIDAFEGNDIVFGLGGDDVLVGGEGNDVLLGGAGKDGLFGKAGNDTASYSGSSAGVSIDLLAAIGVGGEAEGDTLFEIENIIGSAHAVLGDFFANIVVAQISLSISDPARANGAIENLTLAGDADINGTGSELANVIIGNSGANVLNGAGGSDTLTGGAGVDRLVFDAALNKKANVDTITDFSSVDDTIMLDNAIFTRLKKEGALKGKAFFEGKKAHDGNDRLIYNEKNGKLIYDKNGDGKGGAIKVAELAEGLDLSKVDFLVI